MANTTNFNWETPDDTDLVKDGAAAIRTLGSAIDTSLVDLKGGTTGQVLSKATNTDMDFTWVAQDDSNAIQNAIVDAKGDLIAATADNVPARLAVGTNGHVLVADSAESTGLKYTNAISDFIIKGFEEDVNVVASAATGTINFDVSTASVWYYTSNATANHTLNFRYSSGTTLSSVLAVGDAITVVWLNTNGTTAYYPNVIQIDGSTVTPKVPVAITAGNASAIDAYSFTIIKTAATPTYTVLETQTKFA